MAYTITLSNGTILTTIADGTANTNSSPLFLPGQDYEGYGQSIDNNLVRMVEHFASNTSPTVPLIGQLWYQSSGNLRLYTGATNGYKTLATIQSQNTAPSGSVTSSLWWDTGTNQLKVYNGTNWSLINPAYTSAQGRSGVEVETVTDTFAVNRTITSFYNGNVRVAVFSNSASFSPNTAIDGFSTINPGITLSSNVSGNIVDAKFWGNAFNSERLAGLVGSAYATVAGTTFTGAASFQNGLYVGAGNVLIANASGTIGSIYNDSNNANLRLGVNVAGTVTYPIVLDGTTGRTTTSNVFPQLPSTYVIGSATNRYATVFADDVNVSTVTATSGTGTFFTLTANVLNVEQQVNLTYALPVSQGGTGNDFLTANSVLLGNGFDVLQEVAPGNSGNVLTSDGTTWVSQNSFITGMIMLWSGSVASIPSGWALCNGSNGTPDLRNRFVVGAGSTYAVGSTGGSANAIVVSHTHTATVTDPGHSHTAASQSAPFYGQPLGGVAFNSGSTGTATTGITVGISTEGSSGTNANLPPYYALCYIMKL